MHHLSQQDISIEIRRPHINRLKRRLVRMLQTPGLEASVRTSLQEQLRDIGQPKVYTGEGNSSGIYPGPMPQDQPEIDLALATVESLAQRSHTDLSRYALHLGLGVPLSATKAQIIQALLGHGSGDKP